MSTHVFVGAGPANLHRALKIKKIDPNATIVIFDKRLNPFDRNIDRERARANIFRFENDVVTQSLIEDGVSPDELAKLTHERDFSLVQGFQSGDENVFSDKRFTQIQIRDLQLLLLKTLDDMPRGRPILIDTNINTDSFESTVDDVLEKLQARNQPNLFRDADITIHSAAGALTDNEATSSIVYKDKSESFDFNFEESTYDLQAMPVVPSHGTATFFIKDPVTREQIVSCAQLESHQRSLDATEWADALKGFGWNAVRPPRVRIFYANDILYIGAEIPAKMNTLPKQAFEQQIEDYTRAIAKLSFPDIENIDNLEANGFLKSRFPTQRGERGEVVSAEYSKQAVFFNGIATQTNLRVFNHGDARYLPHYQTGSGFVTAFSQNQLYADIYSKQSFDELFVWAQQEGLVSQQTDINKLKRSYQFNISHSQALKAFQRELYIVGSRDIIEGNKEKVGHYFNALHKQSVDLMASQFDDYLKVFNNKLNLSLPKSDIQDFDGKLVIVQMLRVKNPDFLREVLPNLLNKDFSTLSDQQVLHTAKVFLIDLERNIPKLFGNEEQRKLCTGIILRHAFDHNKQAIPALLPMAHDFSLVSNKDIKLKINLRVNSGIDHLMTELEKLGEKTLELRVKSEQNPRDYQDIYNESQKLYDTLCDEIIKFAISNRDTESAQKLHVRFAASISEARASILTEGLGFKEILSGIWKAMKHLVYVVLGQDSPYSQVAGNRSRFFVTEAEKNLNEIEDEAKDLSDFIEAESISNSPSN